jgi:hypothetical protein
MEIKTNFDTSSLSTLISDVLVEYIEDLTWAVPNNPAALIVVVGAKDEIESWGLELVTNLLYYQCVDSNLEARANELNE